MRTLHLVDSPLLERTAELDSLRTTVLGGRGVLVLEAAAGLGKTALLEEAAALAEETGWQVRRATPGPLEQHFPFGVIRALLETPVRESGLVLEGAAGAAGALLLDGSAPTGDSAMMLIAHSVLWVCKGLAERQPLALVVDDAQFADRTSLAVLAYLARRIEDLPLLIVIASREPLSMLGDSRLTTVLRPQPLSPRGALALFGGARDCHRETGGNPWLLTELARELEAHGTLGVHVSDEARGVVRRRLDAVAPRDRGVAEALAVLGDGAAPHVLAAVAGVLAAELAPARDALVAAGLLAPGGERFAHALIAAAVDADLLLTERERLHREAARALMDTDPRAVAAHLLECGPLGDPEVTEFLVCAARTAPPAVAVRYLERALAERAPGDDRPAILAALASVAYDAGLADAGPRLRSALRTTPGDPELLTRLAALAFFEGGEPAEGMDAPATLDALMADPAERERRLRALEAVAGQSGAAVNGAASNGAATASGAAAGGAAANGAAAAAGAGAGARDPLAERAVLAHRAWSAVEAGDPAAASLALRALDGNVLLRAAHQRGGYVLATRVLVACDHPAAAAAIEALREHALLPVRVATAWLAAEHALRTGRVGDAERHARFALALAGDRFAPMRDGARDVLVAALAERGAFEEAEEHATGLARARLALARGDFERAHAGAIEAQAPASWRAIAARALAHMGRRQQAAALADAELDRARRFRAPGEIAGAFHARALAESDPAARVALCEAGLSVGAPGLESVRLRLELGSALAYTGRRVEARDALRPALADADAAGALLLARRARRELVATGLRPRQAAIAGSAALTPRQRQICELAALGKGNRAIAEELFLSIKTVETHLAAGYRKLGVSTRGELAAELAA